MSLDFEKTPMRRKAGKIAADIAFGGDFPSEFSAEENEGWLRQYHRPACPARRGYLIEGDESFPLKIWEQINEDKLANHLDTMYQLVWVDDETLTRAVGNAEPVEGD